MGILNKAFRKVVIRRKEVDGLAHEVRQLQKQMRRQAAQLEQLQQTVSDQQQALTSLYKLLYDRVHDLTESCPLKPDSQKTESGTVEAFGKQWETLPDGNYLLSDPWFRDNVARILSEEEIQLDPSWFAGKKVLDAGCGNGRWAYGFCQLGADLTAVDVNTSAIDATKKALVPFTNSKQFIQTPLEALLTVVERESFDLVFSWGVLHHCTRYLDSLAQVAGAVKPGGILYLYLYGRESLPLAQDLEVFKKRVAYNFLMNDAERTSFLEHLVEIGGESVHNYHDVYAPLLNRRFTFEEVAAQLEAFGFTNITQTLEHSEVFVRAIKGAPSESYPFTEENPPYWFTHHQR